MLPDTNCKPDSVPTKKVYGLQGGALANAAAVDPISGEHLVTAHPPAAHSRLRRGLSEYLVAARSVSSCSALRHPAGKWPLCMLACRQLMARASPGGTSEQKLRSARGHSLRAGRRK